ncbi:MAG: hypothetical protein CVT64_04010 [Actinobacteria bacterium HGW-Actinobacteria-4]|nr:MAG: hypothetical protein CVT64_04010 [Actinobacteria bacterium HGW-Actinobacteria-4]
MHDRTGVADTLVWPHVVRPQAALVYLDLNHFINLAKAGVGQNTPPGYTVLLDAVRRAVGSRRAHFPLSAEHLIELSMVKDPRQRRDVAHIMEELSDFFYLLGRPELGELEIHAGIHARQSEAPMGLPLELVGKGFGRALGIAGRLRIVDSDGNDASGSAKRSMGAESFEALMTSSNTAMERMMLAGPEDSEIAELRSNGYAPELAQDAHKSRLGFEHDLSAKLALDGRWRRGRLRDVVAGREVHHEWLDAFNRQYSLIGRKQLAVGDETVLGVFCAAPHIQVAISLKTVMHRDANHRWSVNDITDIDAASVAFAYCDALYTDKAVRNRLTSSTELRRFRTFLPREPHELAEWLDELPERPGHELLVPVSTGATTPTQRRPR